MGIRPPSLHVKSCSGEGCTVSANSVAGLQRLTQFPGPQPTGATQASDASSFLL